MSESAAAALKRQIEDAFAGVPYPGDDRLIDVPGHWECADLVPVLRGKHWKDLTWEELRFHSIHCLSTAALQFFLPAWLFAAIDDRPDFMPFTVSALSFEEAPADSERIAGDAWRAERYRVFDEAQRDAIRAFLAHARDAADKYFIQGEIDAQLQGYWRRPAG